VERTNSVGDIKGSWATSSDVDALTRRAIHETGHAIGFDDRYDPVTAAYISGGYPGFAYDAMAEDDPSHALRVLDPVHVSDYLSFAAGLNPAPAPAGPGKPPPMPSPAKTFLVSGHLDDTHSGALKPTDPTFGAQQTAARIAATGRASRNTAAWDRVKATPTGTVNDLFPNVPVRPKPVPPPPAPAKKKKP
jgi:hypothetical protein